MAKDRNRGNGGGASGEGGAPAEASVPESQLPIGPNGEPLPAGGGDAQPTDIPPDQQAPAPLDVAAVQRRFVDRLPSLIAARETLAALEAEHEADGDVIAVVLLEQAKASKQPPLIELGGIEWRAKHDATKRGGKLHLFEVVKHKPLQLGQ